MYRLVGFTGTAKGATDFQLRSLARWVRTRQIIQFHHGMCVGADEQAHHLIREEKPETYIHGHPPIDKKAFADVKVDVLWDEDDYLARDRDIVHAVHEMIAMPKGYKEERRGGTWYTIRFALSEFIPVTIIWPDGGLKRVRSRAQL
jgi:hypothetical protein